MQKVFINSLPKSGTNLISKALDLFDYSNAGHIGPVDITSKGWLSRARRILYRPIYQGFLVGIFIPVEIRRQVIIDKLRRVKSGQYLTAHVGYTEDILLKVQEMNFKLILMIRDPRAVIASYVPYILKARWHFLYEYFNKIDNEERYKIALNGYFGNRKISIQSMYTRCLSLVHWINSKSVLLVKFEDLIGIKGGGDDQKQRETLKRICSHIDAPLEKIDYVMNNLFGYTPGRKTFREGKIDSWREEIPYSIQKEMKKRLQPILQKWGYIT